MICTSITSHLRTWHPWILGPHPLSVRDPHPKVQNLLRSHICLSHPARTFLSGQFEHADRLKAFRNLRSLLALIDIPNPPTLHLREHLACHWLPLMVFPRILLTFKDFRRQLGHAPTVSPACGPILPP